MRKLAIGLGSVSLLIAGVLSVSAAAPQVGQSAPDFTAVDIALHQRAHSAQSFGGNAHLIRRGPRQRSSGSEQWGERKEQPSLE